MNPDDYHSEIAEKQQAQVAIFCCAEANLLHIRCACHSLVRKIV